MAEREAPLSALLVPQNVFVALEAMSPRAVPSPGARQQYLGPAEARLIRTFLRVPRGLRHLRHLFVLSLWGKGADKGLGCEGSQHAARLCSSTSKWGFCLLDK